jgi:hypothetical protein
LAHRAALAGRFGWTEPDFGSHAGQLGTGHGAGSTAPSTGMGIPLPREREFEEIIMVEVSIEEMYGSD